MDKAMERLKFAIKLANAQLKAGRHVIIEHPVGYQIWSKRCLKKSFARYKCYEAKLDQCELGLKFLHMALRKRTRIVTSMPSLSEALNKKQCSGKHPHKLIVGRENCVNISKVSQTWTPRMCRYIV